MGAKRWSKYRMIGCKPLDFTVLPSLLAVNAAIRQQLRPFHWRT
jgi:hypothetical protein